MAKQIILLGEAIKSMVAKLNANFTELYNSIANIPTKLSQLTNDSGYITANDAAVTGKVDKVTGKGLSTNDYTTAEKEKLAGIAAGAQVNVIESVKVDGTAQAVSGKAVNIDLSAYAKKSDISAVYKYQGSKANYAALPTTGNEIGHVWNVEDTGMNYAWDGITWDPLGSSVDLSGYMTAEQINAALANKVTAVSGKGLSTNDYTTAEKNKLAQLAAPTTLAFTVDSWGSADSDGYYTHTITTNRMPVKVMKDGEEVLVQVNHSGSAITLISEVAFEGYVIVV